MKSQIVLCTYVRIYALLLYLPELCLVCPYKLLYLNITRVPTGTAKELTLNRVTLLY
jgi:hypothetical protein